jgi:hypothetical protein
MPSSNKRHHRMGAGAGGLVAPVPGAIPRWLGVATTATPGGEVGGCGAVIRAPRSNSGRGGRNGSHLARLYSGRIREPNWLARRKSNRGPSGPEGPWRNAPRKAPWRGGALDTPLRCNLAPYVPPLAKCLGRTGSGQRFTCKQEVATMSRVGCLDRPPGSFSRLAGAAPFGGSFRVQGHPNIIHPPAVLPTIRAELAHDVGWVTVADADAIPVPTMNRVIRRP